MYDIPHGPLKWGEFRFFGDYCPKCGTFNSDFNKNSTTSFLLFIVIVAVLYLTSIF